MLITAALLLSAVALCLVFALPALVQFGVDALRYGLDAPAKKELFLRAAYEVDVLANYLYAPMLNAYFIRRGGYHFGKYRETISSALGKNWTQGTLTTVGLGLVGLLNALDRSHCYRYIEGEWPALPEPPRVPRWKTQLFLLLTGVLMGLTIGLFRLL